MIQERPTFWADYYARHRAKELIRVAEWSRANPDKKREMYRDWYESNPEYHNEWRRKNIDKCRERQRRAYAKKQATPRGRLENSIRSGVHKGLIKGSKASRKTFELLGYSVDQLMRHLANRFQPGMSFDNYGEWHVDHIIPLAAHNYETPDDQDFKRAWALKNLQPLWEPDNLSKSDKLEKEFQPSLALH
jgi:5-methylcytosine-specific restriction endonuclease McrA